MDTRAIINETGRPNLVAAYMAGLAGQPAGNESSFYQLFQQFLMGGLSTQTNVEQQPQLDDRRAVESYSEVKEPEARQDAEPEQIVNEETVSADDSQPKEEAKEKVVAHEVEAVQASNVNQPVAKVQQKVETISAKAQAEVVQTQQQFHSGLEDSTGTGIDMQRTTTPVGTQQGQAAQASSTSAVASSSPEATAETIPGVSMATPVRSASVADKSVVRSATAQALDVKEIAVTNAKVEQPMSAGGTTVAERVSEQASANGALSLQATKIATNIAARGAEAVGGVDAMMGAEGGAKGSNSGQLSLGANSEKVLEGKIQQAVAKLSPSLQAKIIERVQKVLESLSSNRIQQTVVFRLDPQDLGEMTVKLTQRADQMFARITPDSPEVEQVLKDRLPEVQQALVNAGFRSENVHVTFGKEAAETDSSAFSQLFQRQADRGGDENYSQPGSRGARSFEGEVVVGEQLANEVETELDGWVA